MIVERAYAKINLGLEVLHKREDSYHELAMVMASLNLSDELRIEEISSNKIVIECKDFNNLPLEENTIYKAAILLKEQYSIKKGVKITVSKNIPHQAGLGGGSADAAAVLRGLNKLWNLGLSLDDLAKLGAKIGSDVPFCIYNKTAKVTGRGEIIEFIDDIPYLNILLVVPTFKSKTAEVFSNFKVHNRNKGKINNLISAISTKDINKISKFLFNDLEYSYQYEEITKIKNDLLSSGAKAALMTGSGSVVYGICLNEKDALNVKNKYMYRTHNKNNVILVQTLSSVRYVITKEQENKVSVDVLSSFDTKVRAYIPLFYNRYIDNFKIVETPINAYNELRIEVINQKSYNIFVNDKVINSPLSDSLTNILNEYDIGLNIYINDLLGKYGADYTLISNKKYLEAILTCLSNNQIIKNLVINDGQVLAYQKNKPYIYDSKSNTYEILGDIPFGYILFAKVGMRENQIEKYTKQVEFNEDYLNRLLRGIEEKNFYKVSNNLFNSIGKFKERSYSYLLKKDMIKELRKDCYNNGGQGFVFHYENDYVICLTRSEKQVDRIFSQYKYNHKLQKLFKTSIMSNVTHQKTISSIFVQNPSIDNTWNTVDDSVIEGLEGYDYEDVLSPFGNESIEDLIDSNETYYSKKSKVKKETISEVNLEEMLYIHSGGSLFKLYDFIDIAKFFMYYFHNKQILFNIDNEDVLVNFDISNLPHILGLHLIDDELRGYKGVRALLDGDIKYKKIMNKYKTSNRNNVFRKVVDRSQSAVLIFNDIYHQNLNGFYCFDEKYITKEDRKLKGKIKYGITKEVARNNFHMQNLLGIGLEDEESEKYFFRTSFLWNVPAHLGKKDSYTISIGKNKKQFT